MSATVAARAGAKARPLEIVSCCGSSPHIQSAFGKGRLSPPTGAHGSADKALRVLDILPRRSTPSRGVAVVFFHGEIALGRIKQLHRLAEAAFPAHPGIHRRMIVDILAVVDSRAFRLGD